MKRGSFAEHYLKHVALGEGCNCAESVIRTTERSTLNGPTRSDIVSQTFYVCVAFVLNRFRRLPAPSVQSGKPNSSA